MMWNHNRPARERAALDGETGERSCHEDHTRSWRRVTHRESCPVCDHPDWCSVAADGAVAICMRVASDRPTKNGGWLHRLGAGAARPGAPTTPATTGPALAPIARRDAAYRALLDVLGLSDQHREHLLNARGLPAKVLGLFATIPALTTLDRLDRAARVAGSVDLAGVPGFYRWERKGRWAMVPTPAGILIPVLDRDGRIQALQIRADAPGPDQPRYSWLSSHGWPAGTSSGAPVAVWRPELAPNGVCITEGALKSCIASYHPGGDQRPHRCVVAVAGVASWRAVLPLLAGAPADLAVTVAFDSDAASNYGVWFARESLCLTLHRRGYHVQIARWPAPAKGIDDALLAGLAVTMADWRPSLPPVRRPRPAAAATAEVA